MDILCKLLLARLFPGMSCLRVQYVENGLTGGILVEDAFSIAEILPPVDGQNDGLEGFLLSHPIAKSAIGWGTRFRAARE